MKIHKEHYKDFLGTINAKIEKLNKEIKEWETRFDNEYVENGEDWEYYDLCREFRFLKRVKDYFIKDRWTEFESIDKLKEYTSVIEKTVETMKEYSCCVLPLDGDELVGITQSEWDSFEKERHKVCKQFDAWNAFYEFCKIGTI